MRRNFHVIRFLLLASLLFPPAVIAKEVHVDVAPFGQPLAGENFVGLEWPEMRRIARVYIAFAQDGARVPAASEMQVQYWHRVWNGAAIRRYADHNAGSTGWTPVDDWFNGEWKTADTEVRMEDRTATFTFASSELKEFPGLNSPGVTYRPTLKIRVVFSGAHPRVETLRASTDSTWRRASLAIHFENRDRCDDPIEIYNGQLVSKQASEEGGECVQSATLSYFVNPDDPEADRTIVTVRSPSHPFSFAADEAERADRIFVKDFGVLVTRSDDPITIAEYRRILEEARTKTVYERVKDHAEQTLSNAWNDMPLKRPYFFVLGCEGGRQRFRLDPNGDMRAGIPNFSTRRPGKDNGHFLWPGELVYRFGLPASPFADRFLAEGYLPIVTTRWLEGDLLYEQEAFADALAANLNTGPPMQGDDPTLAFLRLRILNNSSATQTARLTFTTESEERGQTDAQKFEGLRLEGDKVLGAFEGREVLRYLVDTRGTGRLSNSSAGVIYQIELAPH